MTAATREPERIITDEPERTVTERVSDDGTRVIVVTRWLDRQMYPPRWRSKNWYRKLNAGEIEYIRQRRENLS